MLDEEMNDGECMSSDEESVLDKELYDMDRELRLAISKLSNISLRNRHVETRFQNVIICYVDRPFMFETSSFT